RISANHKTHCNATHSTTSRPLNPQLSHNVHTLPEVTKMAPHNPNPSESATPSSSTPGNIIHTTPRPRPRLISAFQISSSPDDDEDPTNPKRAPNALVYPRLLTLTARTLLATYEIAVLVLALRFLAKWNSVLDNFGNPFKQDRYSAAVGTLAVALVVDPIAAVTSALGWYGRFGLWGWAVLFDVVVGVMGCLTPYFEARVDRNGNSSKELGGFVALLYSLS
ncbi:hypothetical protein QBC34DRAFT_472290, partial [Podospora aff. communis PSN243]